MKKQTNNAIRTILKYFHVRLYTIRNNGSDVFIFGKIPLKAKAEIKNITNKYNFNFLNQK